MLDQFNGEVGVLNVGAGDTKLTFDPSKPKDRERAAKIVEDMIRRGYSILVQVGEQIFDGKKEPIFRRAQRFDPRTCEYIVAMGPDEVVDIGTGAIVREPEVKLRKDGQPDMRGRHTRNRGDRLRIRAERTRAVSVGRNAGG